ncbi:type 2 lantipeptide synthetase LanM family protein [Clostridium perfringens]|uniref:type 2 lanthipeptide synthetase LanM family protein n=1 Tax=Clostridium perfringens TaxID=1502 RepID=UPI0018E461AA|nr:type 2 lanthipeptide synthetase LanM family protein [Clostridium perfringens]MBI6030477.1 type 2 lantipeptide synthetase LanM family protein [Clostridium perfringens]MBI6033671.1 type 2 lantipeptide synthetase LanM family protein [Clostridium perfringens]
MVSLNPDYLFERKGKSMMKNDIIQDKYLNNYDSSDIVNSKCNILANAFGNFQKAFLSYCEKNINVSIEKFLFKYSFEIDKETIMRSLLDSISEEITDLSIRTLIVELNNLKSNNLLKGETSAERYNYFNQKLADELYLREIFSKYPVLLYLIDTKITNRLILINEILERLGQDKQYIENKFNMNVSNLTDINISSGDSHNNGKKVTVLQFGEKHIIYKPHGLSPENLFNEIIDYLNENVNFKFKLKKLECIDCNAYGWQEFAIYSKAENSDDVYKFYYRTGVFLAIFYMFSCSDLHHENILACKDTPAIFDLETLVSISNKSDKVTTVDTQVNKEILESVLGTLLLPVNFANGCFDFDLSGMAGSDEMVSSKWFYFDIENLGTDDICLKKKACTSPKAKNALILNHEVVSPKLNFESIKNGFSDCYFNLEKNISEILNIVSNTTLIVRHVLKPTAIYARFLEASTYPNYLVSMEAMKNLFSKLNKNSSNNDIANCEIDALMKHDIPYFSTYINSTTVIGNNNKNIPNYYTKSVYNVIEDNIKSFTKNDFTKQLYYIAQSLSTISGDVNNYKYNYEFNEKNSYIYNARLIAEQIYNLSMFNSEKSEACFLMTLESKNANKNIDVMDLNLYTGGGIILFLAILGSELGEQRYINLAEQFLNYQLSKVNSDEPVSAFMGNGSKIYICYNMYKITNNKLYYEKAHEMLLKIKSNTNSSKDFITGIAGLIIVLVNIFEKEQDKIWLEKAELLGKSLYSYLIEKQDNLLTGLAHGFSGFAWALIKLGIATKTQDYLDLGIKLIKKENIYYTASENNWMDLRKENQYLSYWCYGAAGISLSRIKIQELINYNNNIIDNDLLNGIENLKTYKCDSDSICHGTFGNIDILLEIGKIKKMDELMNLAKNLANYELTNIQNNGVTLGDNSFIIDYSFMQGVSGIGYSLVRLVNNNYPCILSLDVM